MLSPSCQDSRLIRCPQGWSHFRERKGRCGCERSEVRLLRIRRFCWHTVAKEIILAPLPPGVTPLQFLQHLRHALSDIWKHTTYMCSEISVSSQLIISEVQRSVWSSTSNNAWSLNRVIQRVSSLTFMVTITWRHWQPRSWSRTHLSVCILQLDISVWWLTSCGWSQHGLPLNTRAWYLISMWHNR